MPYVLSRSGEEYLRPAADMKGATCCATSEKGERHEVTELPLDPSIHSCSGSLRKIHSRAGPAITFR
jgi:hypothetical protein